MTLRLPSIAVLAALALSSVAVHADPADARQKAAEARQKAADARHKAQDAREHAAAARKSGDSEEAKKAQEAAKAARTDAKEARKDAHEAARDARGDAGVARVDVRKTRRARRQKRRAELRAKWGDALLRHPAVRAELKVHAWRLARLHRIRQLATGADAGKPDVVARVDALIAKEQARHDKRMATLQSKGGEE